MLKQHRVFTGLSGLLALLLAAGACERNAGPEVLRAEPRENQRIVLDDGSVYVGDNWVNVDTTLQEPNGQSERVDILVGGVLDQDQYGVQVQMTRGQIGEGEFSLLIEEKPRDVGIALVRIYDPVTGESLDAQGGTLRLEIAGGVIEGRVDAEPSSLSGNFGAPINFGCAVPAEWLGMDPALVPVDTSTGERDPVSDQNLESEPCRALAAKMGIAVD